MKVNGLIKKNSYKSYNKASELLKGEELEGIEDDVVPHHQQMPLGDLIQPGDSHLHYSCKVSEKVR